MHNYQCTSNAGYSLKSQRMVDQTSYIIQRINEYFHKFVNSCCCISINLAFSDFDLV